MKGRGMRLSFRTRLGLIITVVFIAAGAGLLAVQYFVVQQLFASAIYVTTVSCGMTGFESFETDDMQTTTLTGCQVSGTVQGETGADSGGVDVIPDTAEASSGAVIQQSMFLAEEVRTGLLLWSIVMLVVFAVVAAAIAFWLARRSLDRIGEVTAAARDISERHLDRRLDLPGPDDEIKELGDTIDGMLDRLELAFAAQDRFVANASHELRTPLTTTRAALEIPLEHGSVPPDLEPALRRALRATEQSERLISALLSLARGRSRITGAQPVELEVVAEAEISEVSAAAADKGILIELALEPATALGEPTLIARAVRNLVENAVRHNVPSGLVRVSTRTEGGLAIVEVENTGQPLAAQTVALLTEPFYRGDASRTSTGDRDGMGLGLAIVESTATAHGGALDLTPRDGGGLTARLSLPAVSAD